MKPFNRYAVLLLLLLALAISACGGAANSSDAGDEGTTARATATTETMEPTAETMEPTEEAAPTEEVTATEEPAGGDMGEGMMLPEVDVLALPADPIIAAGSSTVFPLAEAMAERFNDEGFEGEITIDSVGTGGGFERFCVAADSDIANASRPINDEERAACQASDREPIEFRVGTDALAVVVSSENDFVDELSLEQLAQIFSGEAQTWDQVDAAFPAEEIQLFSPGSDSGTFDYFVEAVLDDDNTGILAASNIQLSEDDNVLVQGVEGSPYAIGYFGYAYYLENEDRLKILTIDGVEPTAESAESNEYPLSRPLYIYSDAATLANKPQVAAFINFFLSFVNEEIEGVGYFPASTEALDEAKQNFLDGSSGMMMEEGAGSGDEETMEGMMLPEVDVLALPADPIIAAGSSTVFPLAEAMAERFNDEGFEGEITIDSVGTGGGFERFCVAADSDIANASRPINDEETAACQASDREPIEFRVGTDALAVVVSSENDFVDELSLEQLAQIFSGEAQTWDQVDAAFPAEEIQLFSPGSDSGTFDYFVEAVLDDDNTGILAASNIQLSEDDNVLVQGVEGSPYAIGYFGYAYYLENEDRLKILTIDGVEPTAESAESNEYPLSRPLYLYSDAATLANKPQVAAFINFFLSFVNEEIEEVGYFPASPEALDEAKQSFLDAAGE